MSTDTAAGPGGAAPARRSMRRTRSPLWFALSEGVRSALHSIRAHGFRSFLTTLGIIIGVASVIAMVSIIQGLSFAIGQQFQGLGSNSVTVTAYTPIEERLQGRIKRLTPDDLELISHRVEGIQSITPVMSSGIGQIRYGGQTASSQIIGTTYTFQDVAQYYTASGRFLSDSDNDTRRRVVVIGETVAENLSLPADPVGEFVQINGEWLKIIGLLEPKGEILGNDLDNRVLMPFSTMQTLTGNRARPDIQIQLTVANRDEMESVVQRIERLLRSAHG